MFKMLNLLHTKTAKLSSINSIVEIKLYFNTGFTDENDLSLDRWILD